MPIYEFSCNACGARVSLFFRSMTSEAKGTCDRCGSPDLTRLISRFAVGRPPVDPTSFNKQEMLDGVDYGDPASMANFFRRMGDTFQDEPNEYMDEIVGRLDHGESVGDTLGIDTHNHSAPESDSAE
jgi:putative FmdB family regulatory protein